MMIFEWKKEKSGKVEKAKPLNFQTLKRSLQNRLWYPNSFQNSKRFIRVGIAIATCLLAVLAHFRVVDAGDVWASEGSRPLSATSLPTLQAHVLPPTLLQWQDTSNSGDYFSQVKPTPVGYLVWSQFPVKVFVEMPETSTASQQWASAVLKAVQEWRVYLPLQVVEQSEIADIKIVRSLPPLKPSFNRRTGEFHLPRARSAETRYEFYLNPATGTPSVLSHRFTIQLSPTQTGDYIQSAARHELGHALGIWGHSPLETDALYFSQVRNPPQISSRDINTLKRIYQQPTRLGWPLPNATQSQLKRRVLANKTIRDYSLRRMTS
ncbi:peptidase [Coleofasciculus sp. FACHB-712]|uniref:peptidase n=1 Tax=Coleofasciculus sp. FACHB-712 TaxID=2692789 RepID=UPI0016866CCF|nr:peptidase [Coleofasciculus sp. FACHB-712]MBD1941873.1 peptidase [Coleofasciculus sp. FACHB-712]